MSIVKKYNIPCPVCKAISQQDIFHSISSMIENVSQKIIDDEINFVCCKNCGNKFQVMTGLLYCNHSKQIAVYYHPNNFDEIEKEIMDIKKMLGEKSHLANPHKYKNWQEFKNKISELEGVFQTIQERNSDPTHYSDFHWTCNICDGDDSTGCLYFDSTECPKWT